MLREGYDLGRWFYLTFGGGALSDCPPYQPPLDTVQDIPIDIPKAGKKAAQIQQQLEDQERRMQALLEELEAARAKESATQKTVAELRLLAEKGRKSADALEFNEETTRCRLIDAMLAEAGWHLGANGADTDRVKQEVEIKFQPTPTGIGYADYVLYDDNGSPLAVVEAKKTAKDANLGRSQARMYADGLEKMTGHPMRQPAASSPSGRSNSFPA